MTNDFQKRSAIQSLWDNDGIHVKKRFRNKGKGRGKDRKLIRDEEAEMAALPAIERDEAEREEIDAALYCYRHGPCAKCRCED